MYYKIENKECEVYKKLHEMRTKELQWEKENRQAVEEKTGLNFQYFLGHRGQQQFNRNTSYSGFSFQDPEKVDMKVWKKHPKYSSVFIPNTRTKEGKQMNEFLRNGLKGHSFSIVFKILGIPQSMGRFIFPYVEICGDVIVIFLGDEQPELTDPNIVEITKKEFNNLVDSISKTAAQ